MNSKIGSFLSRALIACMVVFLLASAYQWAKRSPYFQIAHIQIENAQGKPFQHIDKKEIFKAIQSQLSGNFFSLDTWQANQLVREQRWVAQAHIKKNFPNAILVSIQEHQPAAYWLQNGQVAGLVSKEGKIFQADFEAKLPEFEGNANEMTEMLNAYKTINKQLKSQKLQINRLIYSESGAWTAILNNGIELRLGRENTAERLNRFVTIWQKKLLAQKQKIDYVDARYDNGVAVKFLHQANSANLSDEDSDSVID